MMQRTGGAVSDSISRCMMCESDFSAFMCKECGQVERKQYEQKRHEAPARDSEDFDNLATLDTPEDPRRQETTKKFVVHDNGHPYFYICQACDNVLHAPKGPKGAHIRIRLRTAEADDDESLPDKELERARESHRSAKPEVVYTVTVLVIIFLAYPRLMTEIAALLSCVEIPDAEKSYLEIDMRIECGTPTYETWRALAVALFFLYGFGIPTFCIVLLTIWAGKDGTGLLRKRVVESFGFLYSGYRMKRYYWEMIIMLRKMLVVFVIVFYDGRQEYQTMLGIWLTTFFLTANIFAKPFVFHLLWQIENLSLACVAASLNLSMLYEDKYAIEEGSALENVVTGTIFAINMATVAAFVYCIGKAASAQIIDIFDDPSDPDGSLTWGEVTTVLRFKAYKVFAPKLARVGVAMKNPADDYCTPDDSISAFGSAAGSSNPEDNGLVHKESSHQLPRSRSRRKTIEDLSPVLVRAMGYHEKYPDIFDARGRRRTLVAATAPDQLETERSCETVGTPEAVATSETSYIAINDIFDDPSDPDGSLTWGEVTTVLRFKVYKIFAPKLARVGVAMKNPADDYCTPGDSISAFGSAAGSSNPEDNGLVHKESSHQLPRSRSRRKTIEDLSPVLVRAMGYHEKYPDIFDARGRRRTLVAATAPDQLETERSCETVGTPKARNLIYSAINDIFAAGSSNPEDNGLVHKESSHQLPRSRSRRKTIEDLSPVMVRAMGYHEKYPDIFDARGRRRTLVAATAPDQLETERSCETVGTPEAVATSSQAQDS
ncbi:hypothetical protein DIPPA_32898 [Diplonema papillatum]|nr:hypothetical protein DIPPA_32898 [Diplonema papillatum]